jgi:hypothetical protein
VNAVHQNVYSHTTLVLSRDCRSRLRKIIKPENSDSCRIEVGVPRYPNRDKCKNGESRYPQCHIEDPGSDFHHPVTMCEVLERLTQLPREITGRIGVRLDHLSMPHLRSPSLPAYGMQWGSAVYLLPIEASRIEKYPVLPSVIYRQELEKFGAQWKWNRDTDQWECHWSKEALRIFYLENVLIHEIGHLLDNRNTSVRKHEAFANAFADHYGNPPKRYKGEKPPHTQRKHRRHG